MTLEMDPRTQRRSQVSPPLCIHYWVIDNAEGAESAGRCKHCGEERCFANSLESDSWTAPREDNSLGSVWGHGGSGRTNSPTSGSRGRVHTPGR